MTTRRTEFVSLRPAVVLVILASLSSTPAGAQQSCRVSGESMSVGELREASGVAVSRKTPGVLWLHNDSGEPVLVAVASDGTVKGRVQVSGATVGDWEDIDVGPCPHGSCIYIGDIGDNNARRRDVVIYRIPEPDAGAGTSAAAEAMRVTYPDGPRDAESLIVFPDGTFVIITKGERSPVALYRSPTPFQNGATARLELVATIVEPQANRSRGVTRPNRITGAAASWDGEWIVLRSLHAVAFYVAKDFMAGNIREAFRFDVSSIREPQGEGVAFGEDGVVWLASEGGGNKRPGLISRLSCALK